LKAAVDALQGAAVQRLPNGDPVARAADMNLDAAWAALRGLLSAWSRLPDPTHAEQAATVRELLFPDGLRFTRLPFRVEWAERPNRFKMIEERGLGEQIEKMGGGTVPAQLRQAHAHYGEVLSITARTPDPGISMRDARGAVMKALRFFVVRVTASVGPQDPAS